jgi:hypothetical protein
MYNSHIIFTKLYEIGQIYTIYNLWEKKEKSKEDIEYHA